MSAIGTIVIPTRRSPVLARCVASYEENARGFGHRVRVVVSEDGDGNPRREWWVRRLAAQAVPEHVARFLLYGDGAIPEPATGANRNLLLLEAAGEAVLTVDDDTVCEWRRAPGMEPGVVTARSHPGRIRLHGSREEAHASGHVEPFDVLGQFGERLEERSPVVQAGLCGDAAINTPIGRLLAAGPEREQWLEQPARWRSRWVTAAAARETLVQAPQLMTFCAAIDSRKPLVPFSPMGRNQDAVFALMLGIGDADFRVRHVPWCVWHEPWPPREFPEDVLVREAGRFQLNDGLALLVRHREPASLKATGLWLEDAGAWDERSFRRFLASLRCEAVSNELAMVGHALKTHGSTPSWWARELRAVQLTLEQTMAGERLLAGSERLQTYVAAFGELLRHWPAIWECARAGARAE